MLVDYISPAKLPWILVWLDWQFYASRDSFYWFLLVFVIHFYYFSRPRYYNFFEFTLPLFVGICAWVVYCAIKYGYTVG